MLVQTKSEEHWYDAAEHWDGSHSGRSRSRNGDSVSYFHGRFSVPVSAWAALQIQALRASWDTSSTATSASLAWSVENKTFARFSQHQPLQRRKQQHCRRQRSDGKHVLLLVVARWLETRRRSQYFHDRLGRAAELNPIDRCYSARKNLRSDTHWIAVLKSFFQFSDAQKH